MGTQPENIERALQGKRTLPTPGEPNQGKGTAAGPEGRHDASSKKSSRSPTEPSEDPNQGYEGPGGQKFNPSDERRFQLKGGRFNAASEKDEV